MHRRRKLALGTVASSVALALGIWGVAGAQPTGALAAGSPGESQKPYEVTLLTGDRVTLSSSQAKNVTFRPGPGRARMSYTMFRARGDLYVVPRDAVPLVASGVVDRQLFDVSELVRLGYHDAARATVPVIFSFHGSSASPPAWAATKGKVTRALPAVHGEAVEADKHGIEGLWTEVAKSAKASRFAPVNSLAHVWLDGRRSVLLDQSVAQIGAPQAWQAGYTGRGVTVAVLDTGIDATHPDLAGKVVDQRNFTMNPNSNDTVGHGTHVASTIAGTGAASGGKYRGVAPDASLIDGKVCTEQVCYFSDILAGMQWAAGDKHAKVVNMSLGGEDSPGIDPLEDAVNTLSAQYGTLFVIASGNSGPGAGTSSSPASADAALAVGAVDKSDAMAGFSSRGPRVGDYAVKPDLVAPGVDIVAAKASGAIIGVPVGDSYLRSSGTSMATPHVAGSAALLAQQHPTWSGTDLKSALMASAKPLAAVGAFVQGAGRVDVSRAIAQDVTSVPSSVSFGFQPWPHTNDTPIVRTVTYHNAGTSPMTLNLNLRVVGPGGVSAPAGMFTVGSPSVSVPAGGQAQVSVTANTAVAGPDGLWSGQLVAADGTHQVSTPFGVVKEVESYDLTLKAMDRSGSPGWFVGMVVGLDTGLFEFVFDSGTSTLRLPKGRYHFGTIINAADTTQSESTIMTVPSFELTANTTMTADARTARPVRVAVPNPSAVPMFSDAGYYMPILNLPQPGLSMGVGIVGGFDGVFAGPVGSSADYPGFAFNVAEQLARPDVTGGFHNSPYRYTVKDSVDGTMPAGFSRTYREGDFATIEERYAGNSAAHQSAQAYMWGSRSDGRDTSLFSYSIDVDLPATLTEYVTTRGVVWTSNLVVTAVPPGGGQNVWSTFTGELTAYRQGREYRERWNVAPFGPAFPVAKDSFGAATPLVSRVGDRLAIAPPLFSDQSGHAGGCALDNATIRLYRDGVPIAQASSTNADFDVPPQAATYRVEVEANRGSSTDLSTTVKAAWTFTSAHVAGNSPVPLPVMAVRFAPELDATMTAPVGKKLEFPVAVQGQPGSGVGAIVDIAVEVSLDDGKTWRAMELESTDNGWSAASDPVSAPGYVSLRARATDSAGRTVEQTIIHAYRVG